MPPLQESVQIQTNPNRQPDSLPDTLWFKNRTKARNSGPTTFVGGTRAPGRAALHSPLRLSDQSQRCGLRAAVGGRDGWGFSASMEPKSEELGHELGLLHGLWVALRNGASEFGGFTKWEFFQNYPGKQSSLFLDPFALLSF